MTHRGITAKIVRDIMVKLKEYMESDILDEIGIDLPDNDDYYSKKIYNVDCDFFIELYLTKTTQDNYMIIGDAPGDIEDDNIRIGIYANPVNYKAKLSEIYFNLMYTVRHELEHLFQVVSDYTRVKYPYEKIKKFSTDSLKTLLKVNEIDPQVLGYHLQSKLENKPFVEIISNHLDKLVENNQINFSSNNRNEMLINVLVDHAKYLGIRYI